MWLDFSHYHVVVCIHEWPVILTSTTVMCNNEEHDDSLKKRKVSCTNNGDDSTSPSKKAVIVTGTSLSPSKLKQEDFNKGMWSTHLSLPGKKAKLNSNASFNWCLFYVQLNLTRLNWMLSSHWWPILKKNTAVVRSSTSFMLVFRARFPSSSARLSPYGKACTNSFQLNPSQSIKKKTHFYFSLVVIIFTVFRFHSRLKKIRVMFSNQAAFLAFQLEEVGDEAANGHFSQIVNTVNACLAQHGLTSYYKVSYA